MYFLIGLGIIVIIVYGNMLYDRIKTKKNKDTTDVEKSAGTADNHFAEQKETKGQKTEINRQAPDQDQSGSMVKTAANIAFSGPTLTQMIADDLKQKKHIFGLPLTLCEERGDGQLIALDRQENNYVIEAVQRADYEEFYLQILDDMAVQRKRIQKNAADRKVYAVVCVTTLPETLKLAAEKDNAIRIFSYELNFRNVMQKNVAKLLIKNLKKL